MWYQEMFNPYCGETKGCFNPTVRGEGGVRGGTWEAAEEELWVCRMGGMGGVFVFCFFFFARGMSSSLSLTVTQSPETRRGIRSRWDYDAWIMRLWAYWYKRWGDALQPVHAEIEGDVFSPLTGTSCCEVTCCLCGHFSCDALRNERFIVQCWAATGKIIWGQSVKLF